MTRIYLFLLMILPNVILGQETCTGNLGDNIFSIGDFGSGVDNIVFENPGIAPGYSYTVNPPPEDGFYIITNDMRTPAWNNLWGSWLEITDNSDDPFGYMMVVNASFDPGIFYEEDVTGLCENTLYEFSCDVINLIRNGVGGHHPPNLSFLLDDEVLYSTGVIPQDEVWHKEGFTFTTGPDQTSLKLSLRNNAPGGIGNDLALDNISFRPCGPSAFANPEEEFLLCANGLGPVSIFADTEDGAAIQWQFFSEVTQTWNDISGATLDFALHNQFEPGEYKYRYLTAGTSENLENEKCRVISDVAVITVLPIEFTVYDTICENATYSFGSQDLNETGFYEETFLAKSGCDSFVDLFLTTIPDPGIMADLSFENPICRGDSSGLIEVLDITGGSGPYSFFLEDVEVDQTITMLPAGTYNVRVQDRFSCFFLDGILLEDPEAFLIDIGNDTTLDFGSAYDFQIESSEMISSGNWQGSDLQCINCVDNMLTAFEDGLYILEAGNSSACLTSDSLFVTVNPLEDLFYRPNVFSPNDDGINDLFQILSGTEAIRSVKSFSVFDRYGNRVYNTRNRDFKSEEYGWDGSANGSPAEMGVYSYLYEFILVNDAELVVSGDVTLIR